MAALYAATQFLMLRSFEAIENERAAADTLRVKSALSNEIENFKTMLTDWSSWDDSYKFIESRDDLFLEANVKRETFESMRIDLMLFFNNEGALIYGREYDAKTNRLLPAGRDVLRKIGAAGLSKHDGTNSGASGIVLFPRGPMIISSMPILTTEQRGPARGALVMGRWLNGAEISRLVSVTRQPMEFQRLDRPVSAETLKVLKITGRDRGIALKPRGKNVMDGYMVIRDIAGAPALLMKTPMRRDVYRQSISGIRYFFVFFTLSGLISAVILILMLQKVVLSRLMALGRELSRIGKGRSMSARLSISGGDELSKLAKNVNSMLDGLETAQLELGRQESLQKSAEQYRTLVERSPSAVFIIDSGKIIFTNKAGLTLLGATFPEEVVGTKFTSFLREDYRDTFNGLMRQIREGSDLPMTVCTLLRFDSRAIHVEIAGSAFAFEGIEAIQLVAHDDTRRREAEMRLKFMAYHDPLTELPNRAMFNSMLGNAIMNSEETDRKIAVMLLDLDRFKEINDTMGHKFGDEMLIAVAERLCETAGEECVIARYSGDEFLLMFEDLRSQREAEDTAASLIAAVAKPFLKHGHRHFITASVGVSMFPDDAESVESLIMNADIAMYRAKARGSNNYMFYSEEIRSSVFEKKTLADELRKALESKDGLSLHYQPLIGVKNGEIVGAEALARWNHPTLGHIPPRKFIPVAEETGLILQFGEWALGVACADNVRWQKNGLPRVRVAVNLSPRQFQDENLQLIVSKALEDSGLPPEFLELEITEGAAMANIDNAVLTLHRINSLGVCFSIDDFGTGYSSLSYLNQFPLSSLKIDASFVRDIFSGADTAAIIKAIIVMTHSLNMKVTAEAVETVEQLDFLRGQGCDSAQGFYMHKPMPADEFERLLLSTM